MIRVVDGPENVPENEEAIPCPGAATSGFCLPSPVGPTLLKSEISEVRFTLLSYVHALPSDDVQVHLVTYEATVIAPSAVPGIATVLLVLPFTIVAVLLPTVDVESHASKSAAPVGAESVSVQMPAFGTFADWSRT